MKIRNSFRPFALAVGLGLALGGSAHAAPARSPAPSGAPATASPTPASTPVPGYVTNSRAFWDELSTDQRTVITRLGGTRDDNFDAQPCSVDDMGRIYSIRVITWKYCNPDKKTFSVGYIFRNGLLVSTFQP